MEEALKAGHVVEPDRDMQFCATVTEVDDASSVNRNDLCIVDQFACLEDVLEDVFALVSRKEIIGAENLFMEMLPSCDNQFVVARALVLLFSLLLTVAPVMSRILVAFRLLLSGNMGFSQVSKVHLIMSEKWVRRVRMKRFKRVTGEKCRWRSLDRRLVTVRDKKREDGKTKQAVSSGQDRPDYQ
jgi:hypothetical protein